MKNFDRTQEANLENPKKTFPFISDNSKIYIVPIYPDYHTDLFPDSILRNESPIDFIENKGIKINYTQFHNQFNLLNKMPSLKDNQKRKIIRTRHFIEYLVAGGETPYSEANRIKNNIYMNQDILLLKFNLFNFIKESVKSAQQSEQLERHSVKIVEQTAVNVEQEKAINETVLSNLLAENTKNLTTNVTALIEAYKDSSDRFKGIVNKAADLKASKIAFGFMMVLWVVGFLPEPMQSTAKKIIKGLQSLVSVRYYDSDLLTQFEKGISDITKSKKETENTPVEILQGCFINGIR